MEKERNIINETTTTISNSKTMEYNNISKSINEQTVADNNNNTNLDREAFLLTKKADNKLNPGCCFDTLFTSKKKRLEDGCRLYKNAGDKYKECKQWRKAAQCYENCSKIKILLKENPIKFYEETFFCYSKSNSINNAQKVFEKMNNYLVREGDYFQAGKNNENLAIKNENNDNYNQAIIYYSQAAKYYEVDGKHEALKNQMQIKIGELMLVNNHPEAPSKVPSIMENIANNYLKSPITKYSAKEFFGKAILSSIYYNDDTSVGFTYINKYKSIDKTFEDSSIYTLCCDVDKSVKNNDINSLKNGIYKYKEICEVDEFLNNIFNKLEEKIKKGSKSGENEIKDFSIDEEEDFK